VCFWTELLWRHRALTTLNPKSKLLLVEDDKSVSQALRTILSEEGYEVGIAESIAKARELIQREYFHGVLLDLWLPDGNGLDFIRELREQLPLSPIIVITGHGKTEHAVKSIKEGAYDFLEKPFSMERLLLTLKKALEFSFGEGGRGGDGRKQQGDNGGQGAHKEGSQKRTQRADPRRERCGKRNW
jgi:DNA-binding NtrC family response regulator